MAVGSSRCTCRSLTRQPGRGACLFSLLPFTTCRLFIGRPLVFCFHSGVLGHLSTFSFTHGRQVEHLKSIYYFYLSFCELRLETNFIDRQPAANVLLRVGLVLRVQSDPAEGLTAVGVKLDGTSFSWIGRWPLHLIPVNPQKMKRRAVSRDSDEFDWISYFF